MSLKIIIGSACKELGTKVLERMSQPATATVLECFPDGEFHVELLDPVRGGDVFLLQSTCPPVHDNLQELLLLSDACRRAGAVRITAVVPYFAYARQDRRTGGRQPIGARLMADLLVTSGVARVVAIDLHNAALEAAFSVPMEHLTAVPLLAEAAKPVPSGAVVVAPDLGAVKLAERYAGIWGLPMAVVHKIRLSGSEVKVRRIVGDVANREAIIVDDMISTGATIEAAARAVVEHGATRAQVVATHGLFVGEADRKLHSLPLDAVLTTDSVVPPTLSTDLHVRRASLDGLVAEAISRLHAERSLAAFRAG